MQSQIPEIKPERQRKQRQRTQRRQRRRIQRKQQRKRRRRIQRKQQRKRRRRTQRKRRPRQLQKQRLRRQRKQQPRRQPKPLQKRKKGGSITIKSGMYARAISEALYDIGMVKSVDDFYNYLINSGNSMKLMCGTFTFQGDETYDEIIEIPERRKIKNEKKILKNSNIKRLF